MKGGQGGRGQEGDPVMCGVAEAGIGIAESPTQTSSFRAQWDSKYSSL